MIVLAVLALVYWLAKTAPRLVKRLFLKNRRKEIEETQQEVT